MSLIIENAQIVGADRLVKRLARADFKRAAIGDGQDNVGDVMVARVKRRFDTKRGPTGAPWRGLAKDVRFKRANDDRGDILVNTGRLRNSIGIIGGKRGVISGGKGTIGIKIGVVGNVPYAPTMQFGGISPLTGGRIPARPFIGVNGEDVKAVTKVMNANLRDYIRRRDFL